MDDEIHGPTDNRDIASRLRDLADLLERSGANPYKVQAFRRGASTVWEHDEPVAELLRREGIEALERLPYVGSSIAEAIAELVETGRIERADELRRELPDAPDEDDEVPF